MAKMPWNPLEALRSALRRGPSGPSVTLRPVDQVAMLFMYRFGKGSADDLYRELHGRLGVSHTETGAAIVRLMEAELIEARYLADEGKTDLSYVVTKRGQRLNGRIPAEPRSVTEFWFN
jgi:hypothetical protein